ncbi:methyltransferase [Bordetella flabilis]|uniref:Uncharacterized protein n=1 Tax=Bordetella flabilis TaxID=463014 RepID=A0A193G7S9_9BORD|nr:methyltransferase [Bordetella flabilis]ANN75718.1 hypothetical protein BAU07_00020 [Bordetella flabilis]
MEESKGRDAATTMMGMITAYWTTQVVRAAALYCLPEHLGQGAISADDFARREKLDPGAAFRLLRACAALGLATYSPASGFAATPLLNMLAKDNPASMRGLALALSAPGHWAPWGRLPEAVRAGKQQTAATLNDDIWDYYRKVPEEGQWFAQGMTGMTAAVAQGTARVLDTEGVGCAADIGGANGALMHALLAANPALRGIVLDLPHVVPAAAAQAHALGLGDRLGVLAGDFLESVPPADLYLLKYILHDWGDDDCIRILENCRRAARPGGRVAVIELALGEPGEPGFGAMMDMNMMVMVAGGRERTVKEYEALLGAAGWRLQSVKSTGTPMIVIEAVSVAAATPVSP